MDGTKGLEPRTLGIGSLKIEVYRTREAAGTAAAVAAANSLRQLANGSSMVGVVFATGASQIETLRALTVMPGLPWNNVIGFHMDEYVGISADHPASFRHYMRERLTRRVPIREFHEIDGSDANPEMVCSNYTRLLELHPPQLCLLGIGQNGHLAFNDPSEADFQDPFDVKIVNLDSTCRQQQVGEGWFPDLEAVPRKALTMTIPALFRIPKLIASVPGSSKAHIVIRVVTEPISPLAPLRSCERIRMPPSIWTMSPPPNWTTCSLQSTNASRNCESSSWMLVGYRWR